MITEKLIFKIPYEFEPCPAEALAFISAHETATGLTMGDTQKSAICGLVERLKGTGTTYGSDIWTTAASRGALIHPLCPIDDSTANASAYSMELLSASSVGTYNNFVSGDFQPTGVTGGSTKYFNTAIAENTYAQDDVSHYAYSRTEVSEVGALFGNFTTSGTAYVPRDTVSDRQIVRVNSVGFDITNSIVVSTGLIGLQRDSSTSVKTVKGGVVVITDTETSTTPLAFSMWYHCQRLSGSPSRESGRELAFYVYGLQSLTTNELADFYEAVQWYQTNVITGGRNV